jgi:hypothetical protein
MIHDFRHIFEPHVCLFLQHSQQKVFDLLGYLSIGRKLQIFVDDVMEKFVLIAGVIGREAKEQLIE